MDESIGHSHAWAARCFSRLLIDNHITEDDPSAMAQFDPQRYVALVKRAEVEAAMVYATCHNGNCYYPTKVGHMHAGLRGRDIFGEVVALLRRENIVPVAYYTSIFHNHAAKSNPAWRMTLARGTQHDGRYWWCCPNNAQYVAFAKAQIGEVIRYDVEGIFNDMTFWPGICVCACCREKYLRQTGSEIPQEIDWADSRWVAFQRFREESMARFTQGITDHIHAQRQITVTHQTSPLMHGWMGSYTLGIARACDYASGDFYGGRDQHILGCKLLAAASQRQPYEFMTSRSVDLRDHTSMKSAAELTAEAATTLTNGGAYLFIDAINPDGTLEQDVYTRLGSVTKSLEPLRAMVKQHRPMITADTALYYSSAARVGEGITTGIMSPDSGNPVMHEVLGTSIILTQAHVPFCAVTSAAKDYTGIRTLILNNVRYMSRRENERLRAFVQDGGTLIATGLTSLYEMDGSTSGDFGLADVFGVSFTGRFAKRFHYLSFVDRHWLVASHAAGPLVVAKDAQVIARINEPLFDPDAAKYMSIHSNPPGALTDYAALTVNPFGSGRCIYLSAPVLALQHNAQQVFGAWLMREFAPSAMIVETNAPACVEITVSRSTTATAYLIGLVNYQKELPNIPVHDLVLKLRLPDAPAPRGCTRVSDGKQLEPQIAAGILRIELPLLKTWEMFEVEY